MKTKELGHFSAAPQMASKMHTGFLWESCFGHYAGRLIQLGRKERLMHWLKWNRFSHVRHRPAPFCHNLLDSWQIPSMQDFPNSGVTFLSRAGKSIKYSVAIPCISRLLFLYSWIGIITFYFHWIGWKIMLILSPKYMALLFLYGNCKINGGQKLETASP